MTKEEHDLIVKNCGPDFEYLDIPTFIRLRDNIEKEDWESAAENEREKRFNYNRN